MIIIVFAECDAAPAMADRYSIRSRSDCEKFSISGQIGQIIGAAEDHIFYCLACYLL